MTTVYDTLNKNHGEINIVSSTRKENHGTTIELKFPRITKPNWTLDEIVINKTDTIVILDDDQPNHTLWQHKFSYIQQKLPNINIKYFTSGSKVIDFIESLSIAEKENIYLLCDYELINQELNGLEIIKTCRIKNSALIVNHFVSSEVKKQAAQNCIKIIQKELIDKIPCKINQTSNNVNELVNVHMLWVDDEPLVTKTIIAEYFHNLIIDTYSNPFELLNAVDKYPKDTKIVLDNYYYAPDGSTYQIDGITLAEKLHVKGFTNLFLLSGESFNVPSYLTLILKSDKEKIRNLHNI